MPYQKFDIENNLPVKPVHILQVIDSLQFGSASIENARAGKTNFGAASFTSSAHTEFHSYAGRDALVAYGAVDATEVLKVSAAGDVVVTGSFLLDGNASLGGTTTGTFVGNLTGVATTASYVQNAQTASYVALAQTASYVENAQTASYVQNAQTASYVESAQTASYVESAQTASYVENAQTASYVENAQTASYVALAQSASYVSLAQTASYVALAQTASYVESAQSASFVNPLIQTLVVTGSVIVTGSIVLDPTGSLILPTTASATPVTGQVYFDFESSKLYAYNGSAWVTASLG